MNLEAVKKVKQSRAFTVIDIAVLAAIVAAIVVSAIFIFRRPAASVKITAPDYEKTLPLDTDTTVSLEHLTLHIKGGKVWVSDADCPDGICQKTGVISRAGQSIVCLPNNVVITIGGESELQWEIGR